ncbi:hypothetical protein E4U55_006954 [Claviceps digitariae]|nr:hypothetical protein E4U55_006954 [Claviceps digitariae]
MYRVTLRTASRQALGGLRAQTPRSAHQFRRLASKTSPADRPRSWKSSALRWGLAIAAVYYYNTSTVFAEEAGDQDAPSKSAPSSFAESELPTVDAIVEQKRQHLKAKAEEEQPPASNSTKEAESTTPETQPGTESPTTESSSTTTATTTAAASPEDLEEEAGQQGAFNPETGEINWDCPCLGGMAHGPCGEEFKTAFSCFVYSAEEPKGMDCIDKFQSMQECFREYPEIYGAELTDDDENEEQAPDSEQTPGQDPPSDGEPRDPGLNHASSKETPLNPSKATDTVSTEKSKADQPRPAIEDGAPKVWKDASDADGRDAQRKQPGQKESK